MTNQIDNSNQKNGNVLFNPSSLKWIIGLTIFWPASQLLIFLYRFQNLPASMIRESLIFVPLGFFSALLLVYFQGRSQTNKQYWSTTIGYFLLVPIAFAASLGGGLVLPPLLGSLIFGIIPLSIGVVGGFFVGKLFN
ncbi:MAG: hypothetical protein ACI9EW_000378 [Cellvibrionaceae bacterium]|jgi:hypothetical protein